MSSDNSSIDILIATHQQGLTGGGELSLMETIKYLHRQDLSIHVLVGGEGEFSKELTGLGIPYSIIFLPFWAHGSKDPSPFVFNSQNPAANTLLQITTLIRTTKPKLCISNTIVMPWLAYASAITGTPHAWMIHELSSGGLDLRYAIGEQQTLHNIGQLSDIIFFNSQYTKKHYEPYLPKNVKKDIIYPGGSLPSPRKIRNPFTDESSIKIALVSQVKPQKGQIDAVRALVDLKKRGIKSQLILIGLIEDSSYKTKLLKIIDKNSLSSSVIFTGFQSNPASYVQYADIVIMSATGEAFGRTTMEGMLAGKVVIGAASAATTEIITHKQTGLLYTPGDAVDLANKIEYLIKNPSSASRYSKAGKMFAEKTFLDQDVRFMNLMEYYKSLPIEKTAIDLSLIRSSFEDFQYTVDTLHSTRERLEILESRMQKIRSLFMVRVYLAIRRRLK